jgi:ABC-2 type transport system permease protein
VLTRGLLMMVVLFIFSRLWIVVYSTGGAQRLGGLSLPQMIWYLVVTEAIMLSGGRAWMEVEEDVRSGRLAVQLIHPVSYVLANLSKAMGERLVRFAITLLAGSVVALVLVGPIRWTPAGVAMFLVILPSAFLLEFLGSFVVGLCAFWLESVAGVSLIYHRAMMLLGGLLVPIEIYPLWLQAIVRRLPFASMIYTPGRMFVDPRAGSFLDALGAQLVALVVFFCIVAVVYQTALKRVFTNGG